MTLGKFNSDRDSALHYLCRAEWCNESFGDVTDYGLFVDRISNSWEEVKPINMEFTSVIEDWFTSEGDVTDSAEFRKSLVGHFLVMENSNGQVTVVEYGNEATLIQAFNEAQGRYDDWATKGDQESAIAYVRSLDVWTLAERYSDHHGDWKEQVANDETKLGLRDWLVTRIDAGDIVIDSSDYESGHND